MESLKKNPMKMFVWNEVLCGWDPGMVCVLAETKEEALLAIKKKVNEHEWREIESTEPVVHSSTAVEICYGGG